LGSVRSLESLGCPEDIDAWLEEVDSSFEDADCSLLNWLDALDSWLDEDDDSSLEADCWLLDVDELEASLDDEDCWLEADCSLLLVASLDDVDASLLLALDEPGSELEAGGGSSDALGSSLDALDDRSGGGSGASLELLAGALELPGGSLDDAGCSLELPGAWLDDGGGSLEVAGFDSVFGVPLRVCGFVAVSSAVLRSVGSSWRCRSIRDLCGSGPR
jgi:hypothetical protein